MNDTAAHILATFESNIEAIKTALRGDTSGYVYLWPRHMLAVKFNKDNCRAVGVVDATIVRSNDRHVFTNGNGDRATLILREKALCQALVHAVTIHNDFKEKLAA
jgi:hypothetical protein